MIGVNDVIEIPITQDEFEYAKNNPFEGYKNPITGQLKTLGSLAVMKYLNISQSDFISQLESADYLQATYVCETSDGAQIGINPAVMTVRDGNVLSKQVVVPTNQLFKSNYLNNLFTVAVFVVDGKNSEGQFQKPSKVVIAGWQESGKIMAESKRKQKKFNKHKPTLSEVPADLSLLPMQSLLSKVSYHDIRV